MKGLCCRRFLLRSRGLRLLITNNFANDSSEYRSSSFSHLHVTKTSCSHSGSRRGFFTIGVGATVASAGAVPPSLGCGAMPRTAGSAVPLSPPSPPSVSLFALSPSQELVVCLAEELSWSPELLLALAPPLPLLAAAAAAVQSLLVL